MWWEYRWNLKSKGSGWRCRSGLCVIECSAGVLCRGLLDDADSKASQVRYSSGSCWYLWPLAIITREEGPGACLWMSEWLKELESVTFLEGAVMKWRISGHDDVVLNDRESNVNGADKLVEPYRGGAADQKHRWLILKQLPSFILFSVSSTCCRSSWFLKIEYVYLQCVGVKGLGYPFCIPFN